MDWCQRRGARPCALGLSKVEEAIVFKYRDCGGNSNAFLQTDMKEIIENKHKLIGAGMTTGHYNLLVISFLPPVAMCLFGHIISDITMYSFNECLLNLPLDDMFQIISGTSASWRAVIFTTMKRGGN